MPNQKRKTLVVISPSGELAGQISDVANNLSDSLGNKFYLCPRIDSLEELRKYRMDGLKEPNGDSMTDFSNVWAIDLANIVPNNSTHLHSYYTNHPGLTYFSPTTSFANGLIIFDRLKRPYVLERKQITGLETDLRQALPGNLTKGYQPVFLELRPNTKS